MKAPRARDGRGGRLTGDESAVSDVVGSMLLVGITVVMMTGLAVVILSVPAPEAQVYLKLDIQIHPGDDGEWGTGDEEVRMKHMGGDPLSASRAVVYILVGETTSTLKGDDIKFNNGSLTIGTVWATTKTLSAGERVAIDVIHGGDPQQLVATANLRVPGEAQAAPPGGTMHVHDIWFTQQTTGPPEERDVFFHVEIRDGDEQALGGVTVCLEAQRDADGATQDWCDETALDGTVAFTWDEAGRDGYTACVTNLAKTDYTWNQDGDHASDGNCHTGEPS